MERYAYFMVRVSKPSAPEELAGVVERLASGEKRRFESADELLRLVAGWPEPGGVPGVQKRPTGDGDAS